MHFPSVRQALLLIGAFLTLVYAYLCIMAFQAGDIKISGTFDGLSFYKSMFGWLVRTKGGPGRSQFKTSPAFARSRENSDEFTSCARVAAAVRRLVLACTHQKDKTLYHRLIKLMRLLANDDQSSLRGKRTPLKGIQTLPGQARLKAFGISENLCLYDLLLTAGFIKEPGKKVQELYTATIGSAAVKRRRKKQVPTFQVRPKKALKHLCLSQFQEKILLNTAFG